MTTILTPELIEKAARAAFLNFAGDTPSMQGLWDLDGFERKEWIDQARAALEAVIPNVVEKCAQQVEKVIPFGTEPYNGVRRKSVNAVRSLIPQEGK